jgi:hypothetical protein
MSCRRNRGLYLYSVRLPLAAGAGSAAGLGGLSAPPPSWLALLLHSCSEPCYSFVTVSSSSFASRFSFLMLLMYQ